MSQPQPKNPLHGVTLEAMLEQLVARHGWLELSARISIRCFSHDPSIKSSLKFLRRTEWARTAVEQLYLADQTQLERNRQRNRERAARRAHAAAQEGVASGADAGADGEAEGDGETGAGGEGDGEAERERE